MSSPSIETHAVIPSCDLDKILAERDAIVTAADIVGQAIRSAPQGFPRLYLDARGSRCDYDEAEVRKAADRSAWSQLLKESGLWSFMDHKAREEWREVLESNSRTDPAPFTRENAIATTEDLHAQRGDMVKRSVAAVFARLSVNYRTNKPGAFGERMILTHVLDGWKTPNHRACDDLDDLTRVLCLLRGLPEPDHRTGAWHVFSAAGPWHGRTSWPAVVEFDFFTVKAFKNGNGHLLLRHEADLLRLNKVLSLATGGAIPEQRICRECGERWPCGLQGRGGHWMKRA